MKNIGLIVPPLTPFTDKLTVDYASLSRQIDYIINDCKASMIVAAGVEAQEYHYLSFDQRKELVSKTIEFVGGRCPVAAGVSHPNVKTVLELAEFAKKQGATAIQLLAPLRPFGGPPSDGDLAAYFSAVDKETPLPIVLYLNAGPGADVSIKMTTELAKLPNVKYIKESSRDLARVSRLIAEIEYPGHAQYYTTMQMLLATLELGGSGATMPPPGAEIARHIIDFFKAGNITEAARIQKEFSLFPARWMHRGLTPTLKAAMKIIGRNSGDMFPPYQGVSKEEYVELEAYLKTTSLKFQK